MTETAEKTYTDFKLPPSVVSKVDVSRLVHEVEMVDDALTSAGIRAKAGASEQVRPTVSEQLNDFLQLNNVTLDTNGQARAALIKQLRLLKDKAPILHMTFAVEADRDSLGQLVQYLRESIHPQAIVAIGLQPGLVAGVYLRTPNHVHDLSLRAALKGGRDVLTKELGALRGKR